MFEEAISRKTAENLALLGKSDVADIAAMKIAAISERGTKRN